MLKIEKRKTREVMIGCVGVGGSNPVRIQSMTTSNTRDVEATIEQIVKLADHGCEIARITVQGMKEAEACELIKNGLVKRGIMMPLVADIHFYPPAAMHVIDFVDKVRINPGNFIDKRASFKSIDYDELSYAKELEKIEEKFSPLVEKCKRLKKAMRIGTNHGSLSDRIMNRFGDSPRGMVESALEFARVCRQHDFHDFLFSMKASNPQIMIQAYRLLVAQMMTLGWDYPLHLGVTEAGEGEDGRIKSAVGIGSLLLDGIGDTIRVSLTEDAWKEIEPCKSLITLTQNCTYRQSEAVTRRTIQWPKDIAMHRDGTVLLSVASEEPDLYKKLGCEGLKLQVASVDSIVTSVSFPKLQEMGMGIIHPDHIVKLRMARFASAPVRLLKITDETPTEWALLKELKPALIILAPTKNRLHYARQFFEFLYAQKSTVPVILNFAYACSKEDLVIHAAAECGSLLCDGLGEGLWLEGPYELDFLKSLSFSILQAVRMRTSKTDFISCPSCGRTLFNLQDVSKRIRARTAHLPGVKIAIMGCIVNGPGEMADADFGYVGSRPEMIDLYVGKECVEKNIPFAQADDRLVDLIKAHDRWVDL